MPEALIILSTFFGLAAMLTAPIAVFLGLPLAAWMGREWLQLRRAEVDLKRLELAVTLRNADLLPPYVDPHDPIARIAWEKTRGELALAS